MDRRIGKFKISTIMMDEDPATIKKIMGECIILEAVFKSWEPYVEYQAICNQFDKVEIGAEIPMYKCSISKYNGKTIINFTQVCFKQEY